MAYGCRVIATTRTTMDSVIFRILAFGDSLTAGYMLEPADAFPAKLEKALRARGRAVEIVNAGLSGDTTAGGRARLPRILERGRFDRAIVELGANDALMGVDPARVKDNLDAILAVLGERGIGAFLAGIKALDDMGERYKAAFDAIYPALGRKHAIPLYPFFLEGVADDPDMTFYDGLHPNPRGVERVVAGILPAIERWLEPAAGPPAHPEGTPS